MGDYLRSSKRIFNPIFLSNFSSSKRVATPQRWGIQLDDRDRLRNHCNIPEGVINNRLLLEFILLNHRGRARIIAIRRLTIPSMQRWYDPCAAILALANRVCLTIHLHELSDIYTNSLTQFYRLFCWGISVLRAQWHHLFHYHKIYQWFKHNNQHIIVWFYIRCKLLYFSVRGQLVYHSFNIFAI